MSVKVGDKIRIVDARDNGGAYNNGDVFVVAEIPKKYSRSVVTEEAYYITSNEYEIITKEEADRMKAEKGDLIRIVNADDDRYKDGDIFEVVDTDSESAYVKTDSNWDICVFDKEYVIHRKAGEESVDEEDSDKCACCGDDYNVKDDYCGFCSEECHDDYNGLETEQDAVNHPNHYTQGKFETIEIIEEITKGYSDGYVAYCVGNALKYLARAPFKHGEPSEDLSKAAKYLAFAIEYLDADSTQDKSE